MPSRLRHRRRWRGRPARRRSFDRSAAGLNTAVDGLGPTSWLSQISSSRATAVAAAALGLSAGLALSGLNAMLSSSLAAKGLPPAPLPIDAAVAVLCVLAVTCGIVLPRHMATWLSTRIARRNPAPDKSAASWTDRQLQWITFAIACLTLGLLIAALPPWQDVCTWVYRMLHRGFVWSDPFLAALILAIIAAIQSPAFLVLGMALTCLGRLSGRGRAWQVRVCGWSLLGTAAGIASARPALIWLPAQMLPALAALPVLATALICAFRLDSIADSNNQAHVKTRLLKGHRRELNTLAFAPSIEDRPLGVHRPLADPLVDVARPAATGRGPDSRRRLTA